MTITYSIRMDGKELAKWRSPLFFPNFGDIIFVAGNLVRIIGGSDNIVIVALA